MNKIKLQAGDKIGELTILSIDEEGSKPYFSKTGKQIKKLRFFCKCSCGNIISIRSDNLLLKNHTRSCGCIQKKAAAKNGKLNKLPFGEKPFNDIFYNYKRNAKLRNLIFNLSKDEFKNLTSRECYYCGKIKSNKYPNSKDINDYFEYNGVDRLDNSKGYSLDNCVTCCKNCNYGKSDLNFIEFIKEINRIFLYKGYLYLDQKDKEQLIEYVKNFSK